MKLIIKPRQSGKTSELIRMSEETNAYILTLNRGMAEYVSKMAEQQGYNILFPITLDEYMRSRLKGSHVTHILIDNADMVLQHIFSEATIDAITMSSEEPERFSSAWHRIYMRGDAISRQAVLEAIDKWVRNMSVLTIFPANKVTPLFESMYGLPPVTPQPKTGHWIANAPQYDMLNPQYICSECGNSHTRTTPYCEMCGAKMFEQQERSDKE